MDRFAVRADQFREQFIGILSHDLHTPLGAITAGVAPRLCPGQFAGRSSVVTRIRTSAQRMERMTGDLLDVTRARLGGQYRSSDGRPIFNRCARRLGLRAAPTDLRQSYGCRRVATYEASGTATGWQVVRNLIGNAIQHGNGNAHHRSRRTKTTTR